MSLSLLPEEVYLLMFSFLPVKQRLGVQRVCKRFCGYVSKSLQLVLRVKFVNAKHESIQNGFNIVVVRCFREINSILRKCPNLRSVSFEYVGSRSKINNEELTQTSRLLCKCKSFRYKNDLGPLNAHYIYCLMEKMSSLEEVSIHDGHYVAGPLNSATYLRQLLLTSRRTLKKLDFYALHNGTAAIKCADVITQFCNLRHLRITTYHDAVGSLVIENLETLDLTVDDESFSYYSAIRHRERADLKKIISRNKQLKVLSLNTSLVNDDFVLSLSQTCKDLKYVRLSPQSNTLTKASLKSLLKLSLLEGLDLITSQFDDDDVANFVRSSDSLRALKIGFRSEICKQSTDAFVEKAEIFTSKRYYFIAKSKASVITTYCNNQPCKLNCPIFANSSGETKSDEWWKMDVDSVYSNCKCTR